MKAVRGAKRSPTILTSDWLIVTPLSPYWLAWTGDVGRVWPPQLTEATPVEDKALVILLKLYLPSSP